MQKRCIPYVSQYSDCNAFNQCNGCTKCLCSSGGSWECQSVKICNEYDEDAIDDEMFEAVINKLEFDMKELKKKQQIYAPELNFLVSEGIKSNLGKSNDVLENSDDLDNLRETLGINGVLNAFQNNFWKRNKSEKTKAIIKHSHQSNKLTGSLGRNNNKSNYPTEMKMEEEQKPAIINTRVVPQPPGKRQPSEDEALDEMRYINPIKNMRQFLKRQKRSLVKKNDGNKHNKRSTEKTSNKRLTRNSSKDNNTIKFYSTVDELNEDTLKNSNISGTLAAKKVNLKVLPDISRRSNDIDKFNKSLHIDFNQPQVYNHITDNKIDIADHENKVDLSHEKFNIILGNHTQKNKDKELSKLVVNELKPGREIVGDSKAPVTSNITFTSENDTLTAMAYIAGNLLNKLWSMEKDTRGSTLETEDMKHEKISDLLDLFKEPLNLKQETFLKNVLERLSSAMDADKDIKNGTICQTIEEATKLINNYDKPNNEEVSNVVIKQQVPCEKTNEDDPNKINQYAAAKAISKINNVLGLLKKFEDIQTNLSNIKSVSESPVKPSANITLPITRKLIIDTVLSKNEANSLNMFGDLLDKITKLLLPKQSKEKLSNLIKQNHMLGNDQNFKKNYMKMFNKDISNMTVTAKDKIVLDYLTHINSKPDCMLNRNNQDWNAKSLPTIEGNILLNLSEFFKMKSIADLINMIEPTQAPSNKTNFPPTTTTMRPTTGVTEKIISKSLRVSNPTKFASTKEKLKAHLKTIIEDLIELQDAKGIHTRGNIRIADALPCIYKIMNAGKNMFNKENEENNKGDNIIDMFNELRIDMRRMQTRRSDPAMPVRPKSAVVLERVIKSLSEKAKPKTRRFLDVKDLTPFNKVKETIYKLSNISSTFKNQALYTDVPAAERIVLLKALDQEVKNYITALEGIKVEFKNLSKMPPEQFSDLAAFILTSAANITLDEKVMKKIEKSSARKHIIDQMDTSNHVVRTTTPQLPLSYLNAYQYNNNDMKISRHQIINHLIRKRIQIYMKMKETKEFDVATDMNYNIAKRVLFYLDIGNYNLAHELFKMLVMQKQDTLTTPAANERTLNFAVPTLKPAASPVYQQALPHPQHQVPFEEPKILDSEMKYMSQDHLIKQLLNIKNLGV